MTLIISSVSDYYAIQAADRLISQRGNPLPFDAESNKTAIVAVHDAIVSISYSGPAYIENVPTDQWIVENITGIKTPLAFDGTLANTHGPNRLVARIDIGQIICRLATDLEAAAASFLPSVPSTGALHVMISGWQWKGTLFGRRRPILYCLIKESANRRVALARSNERHLRGRVSLGRVPGHHIPQQEWTRLVEDATQFNCLEHWEKRLCQMIRDASDRHPGLIGKDIMLVHMSPPSHRTVHVRFCPDPNRLSSPTLYDHSAIFSPWIVDERQILAPSRVVGFTQFRLKNWAIVLNTGDSPMFGALVGQKRPKWP